jgi:hypothetical protein
MAEENLIQALARNRRGGQSGLARWLYKNHATLGPTMNAPRAPWTALARTAAERGLTFNGQPYSRQAVREAWKRVDRDMARIQLPGPVATPVRAIVSPPSPTIPVPPLPNGTADERRRSNSFRQWNPTTTDEDIERLVGKPRPKSD